MTLGSLLAAELGLQLRRVGSGGRLTFGVEEQVIWQWIERHSRLEWVVTDSPWLLEARLIGEIPLPLELDQNRHGILHVRLSSARAEQRTLARQFANFGVHFRTGRVWLKPAEDPVWDVRRVRVAPRR